MVKLEKTDHSPYLGAFVPKDRRCWRNPPLPTMYQPAQSFWKRVFEDQDLQTWHKTHCLTGSDDFLSPICFKSWIPTTGITNHWKNIINSVCKNLQIDLQDKQINQCNCSFSDYHPQHWSSRFTRSATSFACQAQNFKIFTWFWVLS